MIEHMEAYVVLHLPVPTYPFPSAGTRFHWRTPFKLDNYLQTHLDTSEAVNCFFLLRSPVVFHAWCRLLEVHNDTIELQMVIRLNRTYILGASYDIMWNLRLSVDQGETLIRHFIGLQYLSDLDFWV